MKFVPYMIFIEKCTHCFSFTRTLNVWNTKVVQHFTTLLNHKQHTSQFTFQLNNVFTKTPGQKWQPYFKVMSVDHVLVIKLPLYGQL